jgi:uncharacterized linocin/CFP29 family protein
MAQDKLGLLKSKGVNWRKLIYNFETGDFIPPKEVVKVVKERYGLEIKEMDVYNWRKKIKEEQKKKIEQERKSISAKTFLEEVILRAFRQIDNVTITDGIKAAEILLKLGEGENPEEISERIKKILSE